MRHHYHREKEDETFLLGPIDLTLRPGELVYLVTDATLDEFRVFLERHAPVLRALRAWTLRIVVPPHLLKIGQRAKQVVWNHSLVVRGLTGVAQL